MEAALMARIDRLGEAKPLLQLASTLGREFSTPLLFAVASLPQATTKKQLQTMLDVGFLLFEGGDSVVYRFKHALLQDAAYQSLLRSTRQHDHTRIADVMAEQFPQLASSRPEPMAHHLSGAGNILADLGLSREADDAYCLAIRSARSQGALSLQVRALCSLLSYRLDKGGETIGLWLELRQLIGRIHAGGNHPNLIRATSLLNLQSSRNRLQYE